MRIFSVILLVGVVVGCSCPDPHPIQSATLPLPVLQAAPSWRHADIEWEGQPALVVWPRGAFLEAIAVLRAHIAVLEAAPWWNPAEPTKPGEAGRPASVPND